MFCGFCGEGRPMGLKGFSWGCERAEGVAGSVVGAVSRLFSQKGYQSHSSEFTAHGLRRL